METIKMTVEIPKELHSKLKIQAIKEKKKSLKELIIEICEEYLNNKE